MFTLPIFTARAIYRRAVRNSPVDCSRRKKAPTFVITPEAQAVVDDLNKLDNEEYEL